MFSTGERRTTAIQCAVVSLPQNMLLCLIVFRPFYYNCVSVILAPSFICSFPEHLLLLAVDCQVRKTREVTHENCQVFWQRQRGNRSCSVVTTSNCLSVISTPLVGQFSLQKLSSKSVLESSRTSPRPRGFSRTISKSLALALRVESFTLAW